MTRLAVVSLALSVVIPAPAAGTKMGWTKLKDRQVYDFALTSVAVAFTANGATWTDGRVVLGGVSPVPYRAKVIAFFRYEDFDPRATATLSVFPPSGGEVSFDLDFAAIP